MEHRNGRDAEWYQSSDAAESGLHRFYTPWGKYGAPIDAFLEAMSMEGMEEETAGSTEWQYHATRMGRRVVFSDDRGFVWSERFPTEESARRYMDLTSRDYGAWDLLGGEENEYGDVPATWRAACAQCDAWGEPRPMRSLASSDAEWHHTMNPGHACFVVDGDTTTEDVAQ